MCLSHSLLPLVAPPHPTSPREPFPATSYLRVSPTQPTPAGSSCPPPTSLLPRSSPCRLRFPVPARLRPWRRRGSRACVVRCGHRRRVRLVNGAMLRSSTSPYRWRGLAVKLRGGGARGRASSLDGATSPVVSSPTVSSQLTILLYFARVCCMLQAYVSCVSNI